MRKPCSQTLLSLWTLLPITVHSAAPEAPKPILNDASDISKLKISGDQLPQFVRDIERYRALRELDIQCIEKLEKFPEALGSLAELETLRMDNGNGCQGNPQLPESLGRLRKLRTLVLYGVQDPDVQRHESRQELPKTFSQLKNLEIVNLGRNHFRELPSFIRDLPKLKELDFSFNQLKDVPRWIASIKTLKSLDFFGNDLRDLPDALEGAPLLASVNLGNNCAITEFLSRQAALRQHFPKISFNFVNEYDCPHATQAAPEQMQTKGR